MLFPHILVVIPYTRLPELSISVATRLTYAINPVLSMSDIHLTLFKVTIMTLKGPRIVCPWQIRQPTPQRPRVEDNQSSRSVDSDFFLKDLSVETSKVASFILRSVSCEHLHLPAGTHVCSAAKDLLGTTRVNS